MPISTFALKEQVKNAIVPDESAADGRKSKLESAILNYSRRYLKSTQKIGSGDKHEPGSNLGKFPFSSRKHIFVVAVDGESNTDMLETIKKVFEVALSEKNAGPIGVMLSTSLTISEVHSLLISGGVKPTDFDAFICNSGSELYYPSSSDEVAASGLPYDVDSDYFSQIEYRWGGEGLRKTLIRWANSNVKKHGEQEEQIVVEDEQRSATYCFAFNVKNPSLVPPVKELRKSMRIQGLRCHVVYSRDGTKMHVIPVLASRAQALRYNFWHEDHTFLANTIYK